MRKVHNGRLLNLAGTPGHGLFKYYHDPLPTNCVADWVCDGYKHPGCHNLAVFYEAAERSFERSIPPLVIASTLIVPGYVSIEQVYKIAGFIASLNPEIPYSLLGFSPQFYIYDLPFTTARHAQEAEFAALDAGLSNVRIGNKHLLGIDYHK